MSVKHTVSAPIEHPSLGRFGRDLNVVLIGVGGIGSALIEHFCDDPAIANLHVCSSRSERLSVKFADTPSRKAKIHVHAIDVCDEASIQSTAAAISESLDIVLVAIGTLHSEQMQPEKSLKQLDQANMQQTMLINAIAPMLCAKIFIPKMHRDRPTVLAALSARVGSISDNRLGGWYSYRASKAALHMHLKTLSVEMRRTHKLMKIFALHPGTVDTGLSEPFQSNVPTDKLFAANQSAAYLIDVLAHAQDEDYVTGSIIDWAGAIIQP